MTVEQIDDTLTIQDHEVYFQTFIFGHTFSR